MNKQHSYIALMKSGYMYDFERFTQKTLRGVLAVYQKGIKAHPYAFESFFEGYHHADEIQFAQLDEAKDKFIITKIFTPKQFLNEIGWDKRAKKTDEEFFQAFPVLQELKQRELIKI